jgi:hypothetical protein
MIMRKFSRPLPGSLRLVAIVVSSLAMICGCANDYTYDPVSGQKMRVSREVLDGYKEYQSTIGPTHPGVFAVSKSGVHYHYTYCADVACLNDNTMGQTALRRCNAESGERCYIFAKDNDVRVDYQVAP